MKETNGNHKVGKCWLRKVVVGLFFYLKEGFFMNSSYKTKKLVVVSMICALAYLCMFVFRFKVGFLTFDIKDALLAIASFIYGPIWGVVSAAIVALLEMITVSETGIYGCIMNFLSSASFTFVCGYIYKYRKNLSGAVFGVALGAFAMTGVMLLANLLITPFYMGVPRGEVAAMIPTLLLPFNGIKAVVNGAATLIIYKPFTTGLKRAGLLISRQESTYKMNGKTIILTLASLLIIVVSILLLFFVLDGSFEAIRQF